MHFPLFFVVPEMYRWYWSSHHVVDLWTSSTIPHICFFSGFRFRA